MAQHYDTLETRSPEEREKALMQALPQQIAHAKANAPFFAKWLKDVDPASVTSRAALARLPVLRKSMLGEVQKKNPPMGGLIAVPLSKARHIFMSPGPIFEIDTDEPDFFAVRRAMHAGGFRAGDVVYNTFSYHLTPAGIMMESSLRALGCVIVPGGVGNTELQLDAIAAIRPKGYVGTPSFLKILIEKAAELGKDISSLKHAFRRRRGAAAKPAPDVHRQGHDLPAELRHGRPRHDRLRVRSHPGHDGRRGRDRRDRAARHRRSGARGRCRRGRGHHLQ
jgi:phenylacetate-CoA ligase